MSTHTYGVMTNSGRVSFTCETVENTDGMMWFKTKGEIVGIVPVPQLQYVCRTAPQEAEPKATKLQFPASKSRRRRRA